MAGVQGEAERLVARLGAEGQAPDDGVWSWLLAPMTAAEEAECQAEAVAQGTTAHGVVFQRDAPVGGEERVRRGV